MTDASEMTEEESAKLAELIEPVASAVSKKELGRYFTRCVVYINTLLATRAATAREARRFPILDPIPGAPGYVPWSLVEPFGAHAQRNHQQSLERLAERGGLAVCELVAVLEGRNWHKMTDADALTALNRFLSPDAATGKLDAGWALVQRLTEMIGGIWVPEGEFFLEREEWNPRRVVALFLKTDGAVSARLHKDRPDVTEWREVTPANIETVAAEIREWLGGGK